VVQTTSKKNPGDPKPLFNDENGFATQIMFGAATPRQPRHDCPSRRHHAVYGVGWMRAVRHGGPVAGKHLALEKMSTLNEQSSGGPQGIFECGLFN
jgi:hypothetical protein